MSIDRRWTLLLVPDGCDAARSLSVSDRTLRRLKYLVMTVGLMGLVTVGVGIARFRVSVIPAGSSGDPTALLQGKLRALTDTLAIIEHRNQQIRLFAGLPADSALSSVGERIVDSAGIENLGVVETADVDRMIHRANLLAASFAEVSDTLVQKADRLSHIPSIMPTAGWLSSAFSKSRFHPILHINRPHEGIDVSAPMGAPIVAPAAGVVTLVTQETGYGNVLEIDHGGGIVTKYAHCSRIVVRVGQHVKRGQVIANVGNTGLSTGPHLHYEIHVNGKVVDPLTYVLPGAALPE